MKNVSQLIEEHRHLGKCLKLELSADKQSFYVEGSKDALLFLSELIVATAHRQGNVCQDGSCTNISRFDQPSFITDKSINFLRFQVTEGTVPPSM